MPNTRKALNIVPLAVMSLVSLICVMIAAAINPGVLRDVFVTMGGVSAITVIACILFPSCGTRMG